MSWDYIIVGAGSAGCALAYELATQKSGARILILEAGGSDKSPFIKVPAGQIRAVAKYDWGYRSMPDPTRNYVAESWIRGRVLGGSSSINGTVFVRGAVQDFDRWSALCRDQSWSAESVLPIYRSLETSDQAGDLRGKSGPLHVRTVRNPHETTKAFLDSARQADLPVNDDYNGAAQEGVAYAQLSQRYGMRCSAADAFLKPILGNRNIDLRLNSPVERMDVEDGQVSAVWVAHRGTRSKETAQHIIICAGAIESPKLLLLSGIGDPEELRKLGIAVKLELPGVGRCLREHPLLRVSYRTFAPTYNLTEGPIQKLRLGAQYLLGREGPISNLFEAVAFLRSSQFEFAPDIQLHFTPVGYLTKPEGLIELASFPSVTVLINKSYPRSVGQIRLRDSDPKSLPLIECRLLEDQADLDALVQGIRRVREIAAAQPFANLIKEEVLPGRDCVTTEQLNAYARAHTSIASHPAGTCRMGIDAGAVVGPDLRVRGLENLWVADASILPDMISGNTNAVCMMIGAKLGRHLAEDKGDTRAPILRAEPTSRRA